MFVFCHHWLHGTMGKRKREGGALGVGGEVVHHAFDVTDVRDHAETPQAAYADLAPLLSRYAETALGKSRGELVVYDPYYCAGSVVKKLGGLGFTRVINANRDFYEDLAQGRVPKYDVLVTNPPYSEGHMDKLVKHCVDSGKPWCALMPNFVVNKTYYKAREGTDACLYLVPEKQYGYDTPEFLLEPGAAGRRTSPFPTFWYLCFPGGRTAELAKWHAQLKGGANKRARVWGADSLPASVRPGGGNNAPREKRPNPAKRRKMKMRIK